MGEIVFNGYSSTDFGIHVERPPVYSIAEQEYDVQHVLGRNGDVVSPLESYKNVSQPYDISVGSLTVPYDELATRLAQWLHSADGYARLTDSWNPTTYRLAMYKEALNLSNIMHHGGRVTITFDCMPQRFLLAGETAVYLTEATVFTNPTIYTALPTIIVSGTGSGVIGIGNRAVTVSHLDLGDITISSSLQDAYSNGGLENRNSDTALSGGWPILPAGDTEVSFTGDITYVEVIPNWWTL